MIPYGRQNINEADIAAVVEVLRSDYLTQGPAVPAFEQQLAERVSAQYAVAVNSATSALHLACLALDVGPGDLVWTSPITFVASANCALYCGADVDFVDIDPVSYNLSLDALAIKLEHAQQQGRLPKVIIAVHLAGQSCDMQALAALVQPYGIRVIEDASHAIGAHYQGEPVGSCRYSDICVFSFHPVKIITTAEGGVAVTQQAELAQRMQLLRSHGITRDPEQMTEPAHGSWYYQQLALGFNYRMTELQAALGLSQLQRLALFVAQRQQRAQRYDQLLQNLPLQLPLQHPDTASSWHLYIVRLKPCAALSHGELFEQLRQAGIGVNLHYIPVHLQPFYQQRGFREGDFPNAEAYYREAISLPLFADLTEVEQDFIADTLRQLLASGLIR